MQTLTTKTDDLLSPSNLLARRADMHQRFGLVTMHSAAMLALGSGDAANGEELGAKAAAAMRAAGYPQSATKAERLHARCLAILAADVGMCEGD
jgi:hypothetical protein